MKIKAKYFKLDYILVYGIISLIYLKLIFSYLSIENGYWIRHLPLHVDAFNPLNLPANFSSTLEYLIIPCLLIFIAHNFSFLKKFKTTVIIGLVLIFLNLCTSFYTGTPVLNSINSTLKLLSPLFFFVVLIVFAQKEGNSLKKIMLNTIKLCFILTIIGLLFLNVSMNRIVERWPIYFSGIHTHSYVLASISIGFSYLLYKNRNTYVLFLFLFSTLAFLFFGYGVRTVLVIYLIYIITLMYIKSAFFKYLWIQALAMAPVIILTGFFLLQSLDFNRFSSGRIEMYGEKIEILKTYNIPDFMLGRGAGSDLIRTESWWYSAKGSHNDFITFLIENGTIYLFFFVLIFFTIFPFYKKINLVYLSLIICYFVSSLLSNGIVGRPTAGYVFFMVLAFIYVDIINRNHNSI